MGLAVGSVSVEGRVNECFKGGDERFVTTSAKRCMMVVIVVVVGLAVGVF